MQLQLFALSEATCLISDSGVQFVVPMSCNDATKAKAQVFINAIFGDTIGRAKYFIVA